MTETNMANEIRNQDPGMEPTGKIVEYCAYAWKLALPSIGENVDDDDDDHDGDDDEDMDEKSRNEGKISTVIPISGDLGTIR